MKWNTHVKKTAAKGNQMLGVFLRNLKNCPRNLKDLAYKSILRPKLEYAFISRDATTMLTLFKCVVLSRLDYGSQLWSPTQIKSLNKIERVQRSFTKFITGMRPLSYDDRLKSLHLYSVQRRFERYTIIYIWKILESMVPNLSQPNYISFF